MKRTLNSKSLIILLFFFISVPVLTFSFKTVSIYGKLITEGVDIKIFSEPGVKSVAPGSTVNYTPEIRYKGIDGYIRFRMNYSDDYVKKFQFNGLDSKKWVEKNGYFYYTDPVKNNTSIKLYKNFKIPKNMLYEEMDDEFQIEIICEAVQAENFMPDFTKSQPWGNILIEDNFYEKNGYKNKNLKNEKYSIVFQNEGSFFISGRYFTDDEIKPGDKYSNRICIKNESRKKQQIYFSSSPEVSKKRLTENIYLLLKADSKKIYWGNLTGESLKKWQSLFTLNPGETKYMEYYIEMPEELGNRFQLRNDILRWNFVAKEIEDSPLTGDNAMLIWYIYAAITALILIFIRKGTKYEKNMG